MSKGLKKDSNEIIKHLESIRSSQWMDQSNAWWTRYLFHFTNIENAVNILETGRLLPRNILDQTGEMVTDNASSEVINRTDTKWKDYVRLYFRPRTPTQNKNEGFRPKSQREYNSHCPVPIFFLFDAKKILTRSDSLFSIGNLATIGTEAFSDAEHFKIIPFNMVYHDSWFTPEERNSIIYHRHAEVIVPNQLDLTDLKLIWCRSEAEYQALLNLLSPQARDKWRDKIGSGKKGRMFFREWPFVDEVDLSTKSIIFRLNISSKKCSPFSVSVKIYEYESNMYYTWSDKEYTISDSIEIDLGNMRYPYHYKVEMFFDDCIMYSGEFNSIEELPF